MNRAALLVLVACTGGRTGLGQHPSGDAAPPLATPCGTTTCNAAEYCKAVVGGPPPGIHRADCTPLPSGCAACSCLSLPKECECSSVSGIQATCNVP